MNWICSGIERQFLFASEDTKEGRPPVSKSAPTILSVSSKIKRNSKLA